MGLWMLFGTLTLLGLIAGAVYLGVRAVGSTTPGRLAESGAGESARAVLDRRFAEGEISSEEYFERESALRNSAASSRGTSRSGRR
ncbi:MAG: SHOCT domain-containing protein [Solirubrobacterales bacterium]|nr:SHOCT domain-containing protein [Solirubrobacterales bacterium]